MLRKILLLHVSLWLPCSLAAIMPSRPSVFPEAQNKVTQPNQTLWGDVQQPYPTNTWWSNMMLAAGEFPIMVPPYVVKAPAEGLEVAYPYPLTVQPNFIMSSATYHWRLGAVEALSPRRLTNFDPLTATLAWGTPSKSGWMVVPLAQGSPYITALYTALTPRIATPAHAITSPPLGTRTAHTFTITLNNGQTWRLYASTPLTLKVTQQALIATEPFTGALRLALVPTPDALEPLDASADAVPMNSSVQALIRDTGRYHFSWGVRSLRSCSYGQVDMAEAQAQNMSLTEAGAAACQLTGDQLLMLALPHHVEVNATSSGGRVPALDGAFKQLVGPYVGLLGQQWTLDEELPEASWQAPREPAADKIPALKAALASESNINVSGTDPYFGASQAAAIGQQALIADMLQENEVASKLRTTLKASLDLWLDPALPAPRLYYDTTWGGVVSKAGLQEQGADFGQGIYNDHHFHYGYMLYAAAALGAKDSNWVASRAPALLDLVRDFANPSWSDKYFPFARHMDFYSGHSWAGGVWPAWDAKNQESSSEAVHSYYAVALLGKVLGNELLERWGRLLMGMELRAARTYYHIPSTSNIYPEPFQSNKVVGILWNTKVDYSTFFGAEPELMHCIQHIPYRPHTEVLLPASYIQEVLPVLLGTIQRPSPPIGEGFRAFVHMAQAIVNPEKAWQELNSWTWQWDGAYAAMTKTAALWWVATRVPVPAVALPAAAAVSVARA